MTSFWHGKTVLITGHTGFKGSWLSLWLLTLGARVIGIGLPPATQPSIFNQLGLIKELDHYEIDIRDQNRVELLVQRTQPDIVFHLAAQPLVRQSYTLPIETWSTNVMGTVHLLNALKQVDSLCAGVLITTDKCYENREWVYSYRENDPLGGYDPYSASKAAAELAIASWRNSYFSSRERHIEIASARAGNVIGGGDWAADRIIPDAVRSLLENLPIPVRKPEATRPWQHVLEPLGGYLLLAQRMYQHMALPDSTSSSSDYASAFNFGPGLQANRSVRDLIEAVLEIWPGKWQDCSDSKDPHEATKLNLSIDKAFHILKWYPCWDFKKTVAKTVAWYKASASYSSGNISKFQQLTLSQIQEYQSEFGNLFQD